MSQQSQKSDFLHEVAGWTKETCVSKLATALPQVIDCLENAVFIEKIDDGIGTLRVLCDVLLPCVAREVLEQQVFAKISNHVTELVNGALTKIQMNVSGALQGASDKEVSNIEECLQWIQDIGLCLEMCIRQVVDCASGTSSLELSAVQSLPGPALHFLQQVYKHCKDSSALYGDLLDLVSAPLSAVFKRAHSVQMLLLGLLDKACVSGAGLEEHCVLLCSICTGLFDVCTLVTSLDIKLSVSLWKCISKLCNQHLRLLRDRLAVCPFINFLCEEIKQGYLYLFQLSPGAGSDSLSAGDDKAFSKSVRILGFQMKVVVALLRDFGDYLGECEANVLGLLLHFHRHLPPCLSAPSLQEKQESEVRGQVVNATVPCLTHLVGNRSFRSLLTGQATDTYSGDEGDALPRLLLQLMVLDILPKCDDEIIDVWMQPLEKTSGTSPSLLAAIFFSVKQCKVEINLPVMLPGVVAAGQRQRQVNLYEHVVTHVCGMVGACPARHFKSLESTFLAQALGCDSLLSMLAVDCWCFLVRYGTADVCNSQTQTLLGVYQKLTSKRSPASSQGVTSRLSYLLSRLVKFMSPEHQTFLVQQFPPESNISVWLCLRPGGLTPDLATTVETRLISWALTQLRGSAGCAKASQIFLSLQVLNKVLTSNNNTSNRTTAPPCSSLTPQQQAQLLQTTADLWQQVRTSALNPSASLSTCLPPAVRQKLALRLLPVTFHLLPLMEAKDMLVVLQSIESMIDSCTSGNPELALKAANFMSGFSSVKLGCSYMDSQVLDRLPCVFYELLKHTHPMVHQRALASFAQFASKTVHEDAVPACLKGDENLTEMVENYINQFPYQSPDKDFQLLDYLREEESRVLTREKKSGPRENSLQHHSREISKQRTRHDSEEDLFEEQPTKRRRAISESDEDLMLPPPPQSNAAADTTSVPKGDGVHCSKSMSTSSLSTAVPAPTTIGVPAPTTTALPASTTTASTESSPTECSETAPPPTESSETAPPPTENSETAPPSEPGFTGHFQSLLDRLTAVATELEEVCGGAVDLPPWFVDRAATQVTRCQESLEPKHGGWFDDLS